MYANGSRTLKAQDALIPELLADKVITAEELKRAETLAQQDGTESVIYHLIALGVLPSEELRVRLARHFRVDAVDLTDFQPDEKLLSKLLAERAVSFRMLPLDRVGRNVRVAMADPRDIQAIDEAKFALHGTIVPVVSDTFTLSRKIDQSYNRTSEQLTRALMDFGAEDESMEVVSSMREVQEEIDEAPIVKILNGALADAVKRRASDIHIEPLNAKEIRVRFRIDGVLHEVSRAPIRLRDQIMTRIKIMAELDIAERHHPQDGRIKLAYGNRTIDFRVSTMPTSFGEKAVLRILDKTGISLDLATLGIDSRGYGILTNALSRPHGMIIATGPTGAGKTTTLYSMLLTLDPVASNILTAEDPIEYDLEGISQTLVRADHELSFADILRSFLRQDPDVIMVGEMRDLDTVKVAISAANTGHLVLSTLHTNDAASAFTRMIELGAERFNVASAVETVVAQRLVRMVCQKCKTRVTYDDAYLANARITPEMARDITFYEGTGCAECDKTGYRGRLGLFEVLPVSRAIANLIVQPNVSAQQIKDVAREEGMKTLFELGLERVREGVTTLKEVVTKTATD